MGTKCEIWPLLSLILTIYFTSTECSLGDACSYYGNCKGSFGYYDYDLKCDDGHCVCTNRNGISYNKDTGVEECVSSSSIFRLGCVMGKCPPNSECVGHWMCNCKEGFVRVGNECKKGYKVGLLQSCYIANYGSIFHCDLSEHSFCKSGKCICFHEYIPSNRTGKCEHHSSYLQLHGLYEYRVKPGEYCKDDNHCISGLTCTDFTCACPSDCSYNSDMEACDCGEVETPVGPLILGVFGACLIILFWVWRIKKTVQRFKAKKNIQRSTFSPVPHELPRHDSLNLNQIVTPSQDPSQNSNDHAVSQTGLNVNPPSFHSRQSPVSTSRTNPINPHPINQAEATTGQPDYLDPPPPYSEVANIAPPPYSSHILSGSSSSPVHVNSVNSVDPVNSSPMPSAPYAFSESATPIPLSSSSTPIPSSPFATLNQQNMDNTPNPSSPSVAPSSPYHETGNDDAQPAHNPANECSRL